MQLNITHRDDDPGSGSFTVIQKYLGTRPYALVEFKLNEAGDDMDIEITAGGGIPRNLESLGDTFEEALDAVRGALEQGATLPDPIHTKGD